tara:strand:+ start:1303 stop:2106 length:804 start_codon:yes stop_codon:yes gene_type:complete
MIEYFLPLNFGGLGDKFMLMSSFLTHRHRYKKESKLILIDLPYENKSPFEIQPKMFESIVDFFHFEKPSFDMDYEIVDYKNFTYDDDVFDFFKINEETHGFLDIYLNLFKFGHYWPIRFSRKKVYDFCWMLYIEKRLGQYLPEKVLYEKDLQLLKNMLMNPICKNIKSIRLEDFNFARNVQIIASSNFIFSCEGMWTHLSRAMKIPTIAYTKNEDFILHMNQQGHFASSHFRNCCKKVVDNLFIDNYSHRELHAIRNELLSNKREEL